MMPLLNFIKDMPKVELHVHLEGSIRPETLLKLAQHNNIPLPVTTVAELQTWYTFTGFPHFIEVYKTISRCICTPDDIELITRDFLQGQAEQNILYTEATYTALTQYQNMGIPFADQLAAINRARHWAEEKLGISLGLVIDIPREWTTHEESLMVADWVIENQGNGVVALGLGGYEVGYPPEKYAQAFDRAKAGGVPCVIHAGETMGPESIWGALRAAHAVRIGHGVRCLEDPVLVAELRERQIPLEVCPTSNICLKVFPDMAQHPLPELMRQGLYVTLNSDDPPMFNTTLTQEFIAAATQFHFSPDTLEQLTLNAIHAALLSPATRAAMEHQFTEAFIELKKQHLDV